MVNKNLIIYLCAFHSLGFAIFHIFFWKLFNWKADLPKMSKVNQGILQIANIRLIYIFLFASFLCFIFTDELYSTSLGKAILVGISLFWAERTIEQFIFLRIQHPLNYTLILLFLLGTILWIVPIL